MKFSRLFSFSLAIACACFASNASAESIGVSYAGDNAGGTAVQMTSGQTAGVVAQSNWNAATGATGTATGLTDDSGAATSANVEWSSGNTWGGTGATTDDESLVNGWLDGDTSTAVTGIPYDLYNVYVYYSSDDGNAGRGGTATANGTRVDSLGVFTNLTANGSFFNGYVDGASGDADPSYTVFHNLSGDLNITGTNIRDVDDNLILRGGISGFQIVSVPEPASLLLLGLGVVGGLASRRRS